MTTKHDVRAIIVLKVVDLVRRGPATGKRKSTGWRYELYGLPTEQVGIVAHHAR